MPQKIDWTPVQTEYVNTEITLRQLAAKHKLSASTVLKRAQRDKWSELREKHRKAVAAGVQRKVDAASVKQELNRIVRINKAADVLLTKLERATDELDTYLARTTRKVKTVEYDRGANKPKKEITTETEVLNVAQGNIDRQGLKQLASALKDLRDIQQGAGTAEASNNLFDSIKKSMENSNGV